MRTARSISRFIYLFNGKCKTLSFSGYFPGASALFQAPDTQEIYSLFVCTGKTRLIPGPGCHGAALDAMGQSG